MKIFEVNHRIATAYHPQTSSQVEVTIRKLKRIPEKTVPQNWNDWSERLDVALCAYRTVYKTPTGHTPFCLVNVKTYHLPVELQHQVYWETKFLNFDPVQVGEKQKF